MQATRATEWEVTTCRRKQRRCCLGGPRLATMGGMLGCTHFLVGAVLGRSRRTRKAAFWWGVASHALLDSVAHDDGAVALAPQAGMVGAVMALVAGRCGVGSREFLGGLGGACPDFEVAVARTVPGKMPSLYPTHWKRRGKIGHPVTLPGPRVPVELELVVSAALLGYLLWRGAAQPRLVREWEQWDDARDDW